MILLLISVVLTEMIHPTGPAGFDGAETILLVDDDATLRSMTQFVLETQRYRVIAVASGEDALQKWEQEKGQIDLVLTDLNMPRGMGGEELATRLQAIDPSVKLMFASGHNAETSDGKRVLCEGVNYIKKPCGMDYLLTAIRTCLDKT